MEEQGIPVVLQQRFWNEWNESTREKAIGEVERRQAEIVLGWLSRLGSQNLDIIDVGCGAGWLCSQLLQFGRVTGTDLADDVLRRALTRVPSANFVAGDFMDLDFGIGTFDVAVSLEVLSHMADQSAFLSRIARLLRPNGYLMMATQNRFVLERFNNVPPPQPGQIRRWVDRRELRDLLEPEFDVIELFSVTPKANKGIMRLVTSRRLNRPIRMVVGDRFDKIKEAAGLGWTLMVLAQKRSR